MSRPLRSLYICYFPLTEPLVQTQVVAYLAELAKRDHVIHLLTFETTLCDPAAQREWRQRLQAQGITWHHLRYHKRPSLPATMYDVLCGVATGLKLVRRHRLEAVHARSHVPAAMGLMLKYLSGCRLIFDIRGLLAEEYEDAGFWSRSSLPFRLTKAVERRCLAQADGIVVLTERLRQMLFGPLDDPRVRVIPCCADLAQIEAQSENRDEIRRRMSFDGKTVMIYVGKFGSWYMQNDMVDFFAAAREELPNLHFLVLTQSDQQILTRECATRGVLPSDYTVLKVEPGQVASYLAAADFAISFILACPSKVASSPTKLGEYLAAGLPVVCNPGIGDVDAIVADNDVGVLVDEFTPAAYREAAARIRPLLDNDLVQARCRRAAHVTASLQEIGVPRYDSLYRTVAASLPVTVAPCIPAGPASQTGPVAPRLRALYISYFPLSEPLVQTQVVAYISGLARRGHRIHLLTFETHNLSGEEQRQWRRELRAQGIHWHYLHYHKRPALPATAYDILCGVGAALKLIRRHDLQVVHCRSHVPATMGLILKRLTGCRLIFDIRGLLAEEYEDAGIWERDSLPFRLTKAVQRYCLQSSDGIVVLTNRLRQALFGTAPDHRVRVIPCCADLTHIQAQCAERDSMRSQLGLAGKTVVVYVGKLGGLYLQRELVDFFVEAQKILDKLHFLVLTQSDQQLIRSEFERLRVNPGDFTINRARPEEVGAYLAAADFALCFMRDCPSNISRSPTKIGEYLAAGLPVVCNRGIGDVDSVLDGHRVGVLVDRFEPAAYRAAACAVQPLLHNDTVRDRCRETAEATASLQAIGVPGYESLYNEVARGLWRDEAKACCCQ